MADKKHSRKKGEHKESAGPLGTGMGEHARKELRDRDKMIERTLDKAMGRKRRNRKDD